MQKENNTIKKTDKINNFTLLHRENIKRANFDKTTLPETQQVKTQGKGQVIQWERTQDQWTFIQCRVGQEILLAGHHTDLILHCIKNYHTLGEESTQFK